MANGRFAYADLRSQLPARALRRTLTQGNGARLAFVWVLGAGALLVVLSNPLLAAVFSVACAALAIPISREGMAREQANPELIGEVIAERYPLETIADPDLRADLERGRRTLVEMAVRIGRSEQAGRTDSPLLGVFANASELHGLQLESARQAEDLDRLVDFILRDEIGPAASSSWSSRASGASDVQARAHRDEREVRIRRELRAREPQDEAARLRRTNLQAVVEEAAAAREMVGTITGRMETMLLQAFQIERDVVDLAGVESAAQESHEAVMRLQDTVDARRRAAARLGEMMRSEEVTAREQA